MLLASKVSRLYTKKQTLSGLIVTSPSGHEPTFAPAVGRSLGRHASVLAAGIPYCGRKSTFRDSMLVPQLVFLPRAQIAGSAAIFSSCWTMKAS